MAARVQTSGKFLLLNGQKFYVKGVTYGPFAPAGTEFEYGSPQRARDDLRAIAAAGFNTLRIYTTPPLWLLDLAAEVGLFVMIGLAWEQHVAVIDGWRAPRAIIRRLRDSIRPLAHHPAVLCYAIGNEIPAHVVRWHGRRRVERFLRRVYLAIKREDPAALVTYVNYPTTEYLQLPFLDVVAFNVYLEQTSTLSGYLARLQNQAGDRPLLMTEIGLDSKHHGEAVQAAQLEAQVRTIFAAGCAGAFVFSWTDEWHRGGEMITGWSFGLTDVSRRPRPALAALHRTLGELPVAPDDQCPFVSVIVCTFNGGRTLRECLSGLAHLSYPRYEVIVVDDGSTDDSAVIARQFDVRLIRTRNRGLSAARNSGMENARGEIVAYIDDDAWPDQHWLDYLVQSFAISKHVGVGGPNIPPGDDGRIAACVARAPGGPTHVLIDDQTAEHIPGCNMAFRIEALRAVGGFDERFRVAGDDVDVCWKLQQQGWTLGFSPSAVVWHRRRGSVAAYLRQQVNYGKAEADLEEKWPLKYNAVGHLSWSGQMYGPASPPGSHWLLRPQRIYQGTWGLAPFQRMYPGTRALLTDLPTIPEYYLLILCLVLAATLNFFWPPVLGPVLAVAVAILLPTMQAAATAASLMRWTPAQRGVGGVGSTRVARFRSWLLITFLHLAQPMARLRGRLNRGLSPWRLRFTIGRRPHLFHAEARWSEHWRSPEDRLDEIKRKLNERGAVVRCGGDFDGWDLELRAGLFGAIHLKLMCEEHGQGCQFVRIKVRPGPGRLVPTLSMLAMAAIFAQLISGPVSALLLCGLPMLFILGRAVHEWLTGTALAIDVLAQIAAVAPAAAEPETNTEPESESAPANRAVRPAVAAIVQQLMSNEIGVNDEAVPQAVEQV
jgi:hypothetical protein